MVPTVPQGAGILGRLRHETRTAHRLLELRLDPLSPSFTRADYLALLIRFYAIHCGWAGCANRVLRPSFADLTAGRCHVDRLVCDLKYLEVDLRLPCMDFSDIQTIPAALGCMYVLEGSTLGSQILSRSFRERFDIGRHNGGAYFHGYGELTGKMWKRFGTDLENWFDEHQSSADEVIAGATWMFRKAAEQLTGENA